MRAAWQAGHLLLKQKRKIVHGNWELWLELNFDGKVRTAQRYMLLAKTVPDVLQLRGLTQGLTLRQAYLRLGLAVALHGWSDWQRVGEEIVALRIKGKGSVFQDVSGDTT